MKEQINKIIEGKNPEVVKKLFEECLETYKRPFKEATFTIQKTYYTEDGINTYEEALDLFIEDIATNNFDIKEVEK
jgi:hypothetical protein